MVINQQENASYNYCINHNTTGKTMYIIDLHNLNYDVISDISSNIDFRVCIGDIEIDTTGICISPLCAPYQKNQLKCYIPINTSSFWIKMKCYILQRSLRNTLRTNDVQTGNIIYHEGCAMITSN